jgi:hypothetical protein
MLFLNCRAHVQFLGQFDCEEFILLIDKVAHAYLTGDIGFLSDTHILRHIFPARNPDCTHSDVNLVRVFKTLERYDLFFGNVSALFRLVLKVDYDFCRLLLFSSDHNEI